ncbi:MAG: sialate O-acetylesterase [Chitinophagaceae bacterium]
MKRIVIALLSAFFFGSATAQIKLPSIIRDSMILQRDAKINLWGWAAPNEKIRVSFNKKTYNVTADRSGNWKTQLPATKAGGPYTIEFAASNKISVKEVLFGDVFFCSGQSNMVHQMNIHDVTYAKDIADANYPQIRQYWIPTLTNLNAPQADLPAGSWQPAIGDQVRPFSAVAFFFAKQLHEKYKIPVGIINASVGGTPVEAWTSEEGFKEFPAITQTIQRNKDTAYINGLSRRAASSRGNFQQPKDIGLTEQVKWSDASYQPVAWHPINIPGYWEDQGLKDLNGIVWYRKEINIPASMAGQPAKVFLGRIVDADELYINGKQVGTTSYQYPQRRYIVPAGLLKEGKNLFVIRVTNTAGKGGFVPDKPYCIFSGKDTVDLKGTWQYKVGVAYRPQTGGFAGGISAQNQPAGLYNAMVAPVINYTIKGFCWYQGEANTGQPKQYEKLQSALIADWRSKWKNDSLPFLYVQLPGFMDYNYLPAESNWAMMRESQGKTLSVPNTAMVVAIDLGEWNDIHPDNKKAVGERLAIAAYKTVYKENVVHSGPTVQSVNADGDKIVITFSNTGGGLMTADGAPPAEFSIAGDDKKFVWATAKIEGNSVIIWNEEVKAPKYVRYAWADNPVNPNLRNREGLMASPFRTD